MIVLYVKIQNKYPEFTAFSVARRLLKLEILPKPLEICFCICSECSMGLSVRKPSQQTYCLLPSSLDSGLNWAETTSASSENGNDFSLTPSTVNTCLVRFLRISPIIPNYSVSDIVLQANKVPKVVCIRDGRRYLDRDGDVRGYFEEKIGTSCQLYDIYDE